MLPLLTFLQPTTLSFKQIRQITETYFHFSKPQTKICPHFQMLEMCAQLYFQCVHLQLLMQVRLRGVMDFVTCNQSALAAHTPDQQFQKRYPGFRDHICADSGRPVTTVLVNLKVKIQLQNNNHHI